jgi:pimeloyl-ACP methyl ester carboxylesterase
MHVSEYQGPMEPWPELAPYARQVRLPAVDGALFFFDAGPAGGETVLLVHGLGDEADTWRHILPSLSADHRVVAPDLPGFGRSDPAKRGYSVPLFVEALIELLGTLAIDQVTLVGHSLGGIVAQLMALASPERVARLALIGGSLVARSQKIGLSTILFLVPGLGEWLYSGLRRNPETAYRTLYPYYGDLDALPEADRAFLFWRVNQRVWSDKQRRAFLSIYRHLARWLPAQQRGLEDRLASCRVPTTAIWGALDQVNAADNGRALAEVQPTARLVVVPGGGHNVQQEQPEAVLAAIRRAGERDTT